jgi:hypothetical protein
VVSIGCGAIRRTLVESVGLISTRRPKDFKEIRGSPDWRPLPEELYDARLIK